MDIHTIPEISYFDRYSPKKIVPTRTRSSGDSPRAIG